MINPEAYRLGANRSCIRDLFEYGKKRAQTVGEENVFDYSLGNPSIPAPEKVNRTIRDILSDTDSVAVHGYTSAVGDLAARAAISQDLNAISGVQILGADILCNTFSSLCQQFSLYKDVQIVRVGQINPEPILCGVVIEKFVIVT